MLLNNNKIKSISTLIMTIQIIFLVVSSGHFLPEKKCCHNKPKEAHCSCGIEMESAGSVSCETNNNVESFSSCNCAHDNYDKSIDFKIEQADRLQKPLAVLNILEDIVNSEIRITKHNQAELYQKVPIHLYLQNSSFLI